jgi:thiamine biosynthesis protein ThiI
MYQGFLIKYAEIGVKGKNRYLFEDKLVSRIDEVLKRIDGSFCVRKESGRIYVDAHGDYDYEEAVDALKHVFGIVGICPMVQIADEGFEDLCAHIVAHMKEVYGDTPHTFKVKARRARKNYPMDSQEMNREIGGVLLDTFPNLSVDVHNPDIMVNVEVRSKINIYTETIPGVGGMPLGTAGKAMLLLSGGIDSPVAGYMVSRRGVELEATYFHAPPYTSERAKEKVVDLAKLISKYTGPIKLHVVNFTEMQLYIYDHCPHEQLTIIMRRYMMRIAEHFAKEHGCMGLITGESIGQVASQTLQSLNATNAVCSLPVYRPVIAFDKQEIVDVSLKINTYETSILPYEDCCTTFVAKHPVTKPNLASIERSEEKVAKELAEMMEEAIRTTEVILAQ